METPLRLGGSTGLHFGDPWTPPPNLRGEIISVHWNSIMKWKPPLRLGGSTGLDSGPPQP